MAEEKLKYKITIKPEYAENGEELGINAIAFVENPAIMVKGMAFTNDNRKPLHFNDDTKYRIVAPALIPMEIYRSDEFGEYTVEFTQDEIEDIFMKLMSDKPDQLFNLEHDDSDKVGAYLLEAWLVGDDSKLDRSHSQFGIDVPTGTLMVVAQFTDKDRYKELVDKNQVGFSIEGFLGLQLNKQNKIKQTKMENELKLPDGEHQIGEMIYTVKLGAVTEVKAVELEEIIEEEVELAVEEIVEEELAEDEVEEIVEEELAEDEVEEEVVEEELAEEEVSVDEDAVLAIVQPKLDEIYEMISEIKASLEDKSGEEVDEEEVVGMDFSQNYSALSSFLKK